MSTLRAERDAALARAEKAEGERDECKSALVYTTNGLERTAKSMAGVMQSEREFVNENIKLESELTAARARLEELQAVCDAAVKWRANVERHSNPNWISVADLIQAVDEYSAALASGAESEVTK